MDILGDLLFGVELLDDLDVICIGCLQVNFVFQGLFHHETEMRALGTITVKILALVLMLFKSIGKHRFCLLDLHPDLGQVSQLHRGAVFGDQGLQVKSIKGKVAVFYFDPFLGKIKGLLNKVVVRISHFSLNGLSQKIVKPYKSRGLVILAVKKSF